MFEYAQNRLTEWDYHSIVIPMYRGQGVSDYHVTSCIALAFLKADSDNMRRLMSVYPYVCMDAFCFYNWNVSCTEAVHYMIRALDNIFPGLEWSTSTRANISYANMYEFFEPYMQPIWSSGVYRKEINARLEMGADAYWDSRYNKERGGSSSQDDILQAE